MAGLGGFWAIAALARLPDVNKAFGLPADSLAATLVIIALAGGTATFWLAPAANWLSRRYEYEADEFSRRAMGSSAPMVAALRKLTRENLSNLTPHRLYSLVYYSHPTPLEREHALSLGDGARP